MTSFAARIARGNTLQLLAWLLALASVAAAQVTPELRQVLPETIYVRDKEGHLVPVLVDMTYEEFTELYELRRAQEEPDVRPRYLMEALSMRAQVVPARDGTAQAIVEWQADIDLQVLADSVVRVPLQFSGKHLTEPPSVEGKGEHLLEYVGGTTGYVLWLRGETGSRYQIGLKFISDIVEAGDESQVRLNAPTATKSELVITIPGSDMILRSTDSATVVTQEVMEGTTRFHLVGLAGETQLKWRAREAEAQPSESLFEVRGETLVEVRGPGSLLTDARLALLTYGQPLREIRVQLPPRIRLLSPLLTEAYQITWENTTSVPGGAATDLQEGDPATGEGPIAVVTFSSPDQVPSELRLLFDQNWDPEKGEAEVDVGTLRVLGALRHYGTVTITTEGDWRLAWGTTDGLTRLWEVPQQWQNRSAVASFAYFRQPFQLPIRVTAKATRIHAEPRLIYRVGLTQVDIQAEFRMRVSGAPASSLRVEMPGWQLTGFSDPAFVDTESLDASNMVPLVIPLTRPRTGILNLGVEATKVVGGSPPQAVLEIPRMLDATSSAPLIIIVPDDDVSLNSPADLADQITAENVPAGIVGVSDNSRAVCFRYRGSATDVPLTYELRPKKQLVRVASEATVTWESDNLVQCVQTFSFDVRHAPMRDILLRLPTGVRLSAAPLVVDDGETLLPVDNSVSRAGPLEPGPLEPGLANDNRTAANRPPNGGDRPLTTYRMTHPRQGNFDVEIRYTIPAPSAASSTKSWSIPLVELAAGEVDATRVKITTPAVVSLQVQGDAIDVLDNSRSAGTGQTNLLDLMTTRSLPSVTVNLTRSDTITSLSTVVENAVLQTWATASARRDRCVFRLESNAPSVKIQLPPNARHDRLQVAVDGIGVPHDRPATSEVTIPLAPGDLTHHTIELVYPVTGDAKRLGSISVPQVDGANWLGHFYWHLVLPSRDHLVDVPVELESEDPWRRHGLYWARQSSRVQPIWENWLAASKQPVPPVGANEYLFSGFGPLRNFEATTWRRSWFVMLAALIVFAAFLGIPRLAVRHRGTLIIVAALVFLALGLWHPVLGLLLMQAAGGVLAILLVWQLMLWGISRFVRRWEPISGLFHVPLTSSVTDEHVARSGSSRIAAASTAAMPPISFSQSDSHS